MKDKLKLLLSVFLMLTVIVPTTIRAEETIPTESPESTVVPTVEPTSEPVESQVPQEMVVPTVSPVITDTPVETTEPTTTPEIIETPDMTDTAVSNQNNPLGQNAPEPIFGDAEIVEEGEIDGTQYTITDTGINVTAAQQMIAMQEAGVSTYAEVSQLTREKRVARFWTGLPSSDNGYDYASKFIVDGKVAYCIEPLVVVILDGNNQGPMYEQSLNFFALPRETQRKLHRIMWYGYGHPLTGTSDEAWMATQLLIWQITDPDNYQGIHDTLEWCADDMCNAIGGTANVDAKMAEIMNLVENRDTAPSFADQNKGTITYELDWNETLELVDDGSSNLFQGTPVLDWFQDFSEESHDGINIKKDGNKLLIDIDGLYYEGYDSESGKTLTFKRKPELFENALAGNVIWVSGDSQKIMSASSFDPTPQYTLSFKLRTANLEINKQNEYYEDNSFVAGTQFVVGWMEDPEHQYRHDGDADLNWKDIHDFNKDIDPDKYGDFNFVNGNITYYPIMTEDGSSIRVFTVGADGRMHFDDLLPRNKTWWVAEWDATDPYNLDPRPFTMNTGDQDTTTSQTFVNELRETELDIVKTDLNDPFNKLNGATFELYEIGNIDKNKDQTLLGALEGSPIENLPKLTYKQFLDLLPDPEVGKTFWYNGYEFTVVEMDETGYKLTVKRYNSQSEVNPITYDQIPVDAKTGDKFTVTNTTTNKGNEVANEGTDKQTEYEIVTISANGTTIKKTDTSKTVTLPADDLAGYTSLNNGQHLEINGNAYTVQSVKYDNLGYLVSADVHPAVTYFIQKPKANIAYDDVKNALGQIAPRMEFDHDDVHYVVKTVTPHKLTLDAIYKDIVEVTESSKVVSLGQLLTWINDASPDKMRKVLSDIQVGDVAVINGISYKVKEILSETETDEYGFEVINVHQINIERDIHDEVVLDVPNTIDYDDIPETIMENRTFHVDSIINPEYTIVSNEEPANRYLVTDKAVMKLNEDGSTEIITDGSVIGYLDLIASNTTDNGGACEDPFDPKGCPVGLNREFTRRTTVTKDYEGVQYDEINGALGQIAPDKTVETLVAGETFTYNDVVYTVVTANDPTMLSIVLSFADAEGRTIEVKLISGNDTKTYSYIVETQIVYTIEEVKPKQLNVTWTNASFNGNIKYPNMSYHLEKNAEVIHLNDLTWDDIPNKDTLKAGQSFELNGHTFKCTFIDLSLNNIVLVDENSYVYSFTPDQVAEVTPIIYEDVMDYEATNNVAVKTGEDFTIQKERRIEKGDDFTIDGKKYTLLTVRDVTDIIVGFAEEDNAPFTYSEMEAAFKNTTEVTVEGVTYTVKLETVNDEEVTILTDSEGNEYHYWRYHLHQDKPTDDNIDEGFVVEYNIDIAIPTDITYMMVMEVFSNNEPEVGTLFELNGKQYTVETITEDKLTIKEDGGKKIVIDRYYDPSDTYTTFNKYFVNSDTVYNLDNIFKLSRTVEYSCDNSNVLIDGNLMKVEGITTFDVSMNEVNQYDEIIYDEVIEALGQNAPAAGKTFVLNGLQYTIDEVVKVDEAPVTLKVSRNNLVEPTVKEHYDVMIPSIFEEKKVAKLKEAETVVVDDIEYTLEKIVVDDANKAYVVSSVDQDGNKEYFYIDDDRKVVEKEIGALLQVDDFTTTQESLGGTVKTVEVLPIFKGETGKSYLRVVDRTNHNMPVAGYETIISTDSDGFDIVKTTVSDQYGVIDVSDLPAGKYYYNAPNQTFYDEFTVSDAARTEGELKVDSLKWGREYMACEVGLPHGYDYADAANAAGTINGGEVCFTVKMDVAAGKTFEYVNPVNEIRKLDLEVVKVDEKNTEKLLNGAVFELKDVTNAGVDLSHKDDGLFPNKVSFDDIPTNSAVGDVFKTLTDNPEVERHYKVTKVEGTKVTVQCTEDNMTYTLDENDVDVKYPLTWNDIRKAADQAGSETIEEGLEFVAYEKVAGSLKTYQVVEKVLAEGGTIWTPSEDNGMVSDNSILGYYIIDLEDDNKTKIWVENDYYNVPEMGTEETLGTYVSGSIYKKFTQPIANETLIFDEVKALLAGSPADKGTTFENIEAIKVIAPTYDEVKKVLGQIAPDMEFEHNGVHYVVKTSTDTSYTLSYGSVDGAKEIVVEQGKDALTVKVNHTYIYEIIDVFLGVDDEVLTLTIKNTETGKESVVWLGQQRTFTDQPVEGKPYKVYSDASLKDEYLVGEGVTDSKGEIIWTPKTNGTYLLSVDGQIETWKIEHGKFTLPDLEYGSKIQICETRSPLGYITGNACEVITIENDNDTKVINRKTNSKIEEPEEGEKVVKKRKRIRRVRIRKMGSDAEVSMIDPTGFSDIFK